MCKPRPGLKRTYNNTFYASCCDPVFKRIPIREWCKSNNYTVAQAKTLLRKRVLLGLTYKGKMYVVENPNINTIF